MDVLGGLEDAADVGAVRGTQAGLFIQKLRKRPDNRERTADIVREPEDGILQRFHGEAPFEVCPVSRPIIINVSPPTINQ